MPLPLLTEEKKLLTRGNAVQGTSWFILKKNVGIQLESEKGNFVILIRGICGVFTRIIDYAATGFYVKYVVELKQLITVKWPKLIDLSV